MTNRPLSLLALAVALLAGSAASSEGLTLTIENVRSDRGTVIVLVFDNARDFNRLDYLRAIGYADVPARRGDVEVSFPYLTKGPYAVFLFHDENGDQDLSFQGDRLLEGVGASGAPGPDDMPDFEEAAIRPGRATIPVHYSE
ncbi:MAG: DUF2141 domain-containing protein [Pseudomonadota bacterium]